MDTVTVVCAHVKRGTRGYPSDYDGMSHQWEESKPSDLTKTLRELRRHPKRVTLHWRTQRRWILYDRGCGNYSDSSTTVKQEKCRGQHQNLRPQKTLQALDALAEVYENFEETMKKVTFEHEEGDMLCEVVSEVGEELERVLKEQANARFAAEWRFQGSQQPPSDSGSHLLRSREGKSTNP